MRMQVKLEIGHKAACREEPTIEGFTHDWTAFVRGLDGKDISYFVEKVIFHLHDTFPRPKRAIKEPPFKIDEHGYGSFELKIEVCFKTKDEPRRVTFSYDLFLPLSGYPPVTNVRTEALTFTHPSEDFMKKLLKGGGVQMPLDLANGLSGNGISNGHGKDETTQKSFSLPESDKVKKKFPKPECKPAPVVGMKRSPSSHDDPPVHVTTKKKKRLSESSSSSTKNKLNTSGQNDGSHSTSQSLTTEVKDLKIKFKTIPPRDSEKHKGDGSHKEKTKTHSLKNHSEHVQESESKGKHPSSEHHKTKLKKKSEKLEKKHSEKKEKKEMEKKDKLRKEKEEHEKEKKAKEKEQKEKKIKEREEKEKERKIKEKEDKEREKKVKEEKEKEKKIKEREENKKQKKTKEEQEKRVKEKEEKEKEEKEKEEKEKEEDNEKDKKEKGNKEKDKKDKKSVEKVTIRRSSGDSWASSGSSCGLMSNVVSKNKALGKLLSELSEDEEEEENLLTPFKREPSPVLSKTLTKQQSIASVEKISNSQHKTKESKSHCSDSLENGTLTNSVQNNIKDKNCANEVGDSKELIDGKTSSPGHAEENGVSNKLPKKELYDLFDYITNCQNSNNLQKVVDLIETTGLYTVSEKTLEFDLCCLEKSTLRKIQKCLGLR